MEQNQAAAPAPQQAPAANQPKGLAIAALVIGIVAFLTGLVPVLGLILGIIGVVFGILALVKKQPKAMGLIGLILSAIALITGIVVVAGISAVVNNKDVQKAVNDAKTQSMEQSNKDTLTISNTSYKEESGLKQVVGEVKNTGSMTHSATLKATFYDASGKILGTASGAVNDVPAGETKTFNLITSDEVTGYKDLKVQVDTLL